VIRKDGGDKMLWFRRPESSRSWWAVRGARGRRLGGFRYHSRNVLPHMRRRFFENSPFLVGQGRHRVSERSQARCVRARTMQRRGASAQARARCSGAWGPGTRQTRAWNLHHARKFRTPIALMAYGLLTFFGKVLATY
jgi:hypothetical protein